jgi:hypothetical protein
MPNWNAELECWRLISWYCTCRSWLVRYRVAQNAGTPTGTRGRGGGELLVCAKHQLVCAKQGRSLNLKPLQPMLVRSSFSQTGILIGAVRSNFGYARGNFGSERGLSRGQVRQSDRQTP